MVNVILTNTAFKKEPKIGNWRTDFIFKVKKDTVGNVLPDIVLYQYCIFLFQKSVWSGELSGIH